MNFCAAALLCLVTLFKVVVQLSVFSVTCKAGEDFFRLPNGEIADGSSVETYMEEQLAIRNFYIWTRDSYALVWYFRFQVLEELLVSYFKVVKRTLGFKQLSKVISFSWVLIYKVLYSIFL